MYVDNGTEKHVIERHRRHRLFFYFLHIPLSLLLSFFFLISFSPSARIRMRVRQRLQITTISAATPIAHRLLSRCTSATRSPRDLIGNY